MARFLGMVLLSAVLIGAAPVPGRAAEDAAALCERAVLTGARRGGVPPEALHAIALTETGRALRDKAMDIPQCILGASGLDIEQLRKLQGDLLALRGTLQRSV